MAHPSGSTVDVRAWVSMGEVVGAVSLVSWVEGVEVVVAEIDVDGAGVVVVVAGAVVGVSLIAVALVTVFGLVSLPVFSWGPGLGEAFLRHCKQAMKLDVFLPDSKSPASNN